MRTRRWKDPRCGRVWEVGICSVSRGRGERPGRMLLFESTGTPRNGHGVRCCPGVAPVLDTLDDQSLALCLDAALHDGYVWRDPRDGRLWWVREDGRPDGRSGLRFVCTRGELGVEVPGALPESSEALIPLLDRATPSTAA